MLEITTLAAKDTFTLFLRHPNKKPIKDAAGEPVSVTVYGPGSKEYNGAIAERNQRLIARMQSDSNTPLSAEEQTLENAKFLASCTVSFNGWAYLGNSDRAAMVAAYSDHKIGYIADQISKAVVDWANFTTSSSES